MGQHLQLHASNKVSLDDAKEWCRYRAHDLFELPTIKAAAVESIMRNDIDCAHLEHGSKSAVVVFQFLVWDAFIITPELVQRVDMAQYGENIEAAFLMHWMLQHNGWVVWGDNDGV